MAHNNTSCQDITVLWNGINYCQETSLSWQKYSNVKTFNNAWCVMKVFSHICCLYIYTDTVITTTRQLFNNQLHSSEVHHFSHLQDCNVVRHQEVTDQAMNEESLEAYKHVRSTAISTIQKILFVRICSRTHKQKVHVIMLRNTSVKHSANISNRNWFFILDWWKWWQFSIFHRRRHRHWCHTDEHCKHTCKICKYQLHIGQHF